MSRIFILIAFAFLSISLFAQEELPEEAKVNSQIWLDFNAKHILDDKKTISGFAGYRSISPHLFDKILIVPTYDIVHTKSPKFMNLKTPFINSFHLGTGLYYTNYKYEPDNFEFRLMQGLKFFLPSIEAIPLKNYIRLEERFQKTFDDSAWDISFRFRYRISTVIEWKKHLLSFNEGMYIPLNVEFFFNLQNANRDNDVIRVSPGLGYKFNDDWRAEFYVSYHHSTNISENDDNSNDFVFRLRIYKSNLRKKKPAEIQTKEEEIKELIE